MNPQRLDDPVAEEAIEWMVRLQSGAFDDHQQAELEHWRNRSSHHRQVYQRLLAGLAPFRQSPWRGRASQPLLSSLEQPDGRRAFLRTALGVSLLVGGGAWLGGTQGLGGGAAQEYRTATAERGSWRLSDGSQLQLNARSRVSLWFDGEQRRLRLHEGEMLVQVAPLASRPLAIETASGTLYSHGGQLALRELADRSRLVSLREDLRLQPSGAPALSLRAGRVTWFDARGVLEQTPMGSMETAWLQGWLVVHNEPLGNLIEALRAYRKGWMRLEPAIADLRVSGRFPLDDSRQTLEILQQSLPIQVLQVTDYLLLIRAQRA
ncbi:FecR family protein [Pseudomonas japonica]|uniref:FecR family protein n=1 Tax=Pseudomonas TaxID=286 RepID=UPI002927F93A|nr:FecR domain-containing protein [Pseudomonas sp. zfem002]MDU9394688.1 DUF4880 domain-containing protein [Pseudomonas sp. zfem002]